MQFQYYPKWRWFWHNKTKDITDGWPDYYSHYAGFGPFQWQWYRKA